MGEQKGQRKLFVDLEGNSPKSFKEKNFFWKERKNNNNELEHDRPFLTIVQFTSWGGGAQEGTEMLACI